MPEPSLSFALHQLTARMDQAADTILRDRLDITYSRFLVLFAIDLLGTASQRDLARWIGLSEPSISRTIPGLEADGYAQARATPGGGNRRVLGLTPSGRSLVQQGKRILERRLASAIRKGDVDYDTFHDQVRAVLAQLETGAGP